MSEAERRSPGRPTLYRPEYAEMVGPFLAQGYSLTSFAAEIDVARATLNLWMDAHPEFMDAVSRAHGKRARWWEDRLRAIAQGEGGPGASTAAIFGIKNAAPEDFRDRPKDEEAPVTTVVIRDETSR